MSTLLCRFVPVLVSVIFLQLTVVAPTSDENRVLIAYNSGYDHCREINEFSEVTATAAADKMCEQAFEALDNLGRNTCHGWRYAKCRLVSKDDQQYQCSCKISDCNEVSVRSHKVTSFRDCAAHLWTQELNTGMVPAPTPDFQQIRSQYDDAWNFARLRRSSSQSGQFTTGPSSSSSLSVLLGSFGNPSTGLPSTPSGDGISQKGTKVTWFRTTQPPVHSNGNEEPCPREIHRKEPTAQSFAPRNRPVFPFSCPYCPMECSTRQELGDHMQSHPLDGKRKPRGRGTPVIRESVTGRFVCGDCGRSYNLKRVLRAHERSHRALETYCPFCDRTYASKSSYNVHMKKSHPLVSALEAELAMEQYKLAKPHVCDQCGERFKKPKGLTDHFLVHEGKTKCDECDRVFPRLTALTTHKKLAHKK